MGGSLFLGVSQASTPRGGVPALPNFGLSIYAYNLYHRTTKFDVVTHMGKGLVFRWSATPPPQGGQGSSAAQFGGFSCIYAYTL